MIHALFASQVFRQTSKKQKLVEALTCSYNTLNTPTFDTRKFKNYMPHDHYARSWYLCCAAVFIACRDASIDRPPTQLEDFALSWLGIWIGYHTYIRHYTNDTLHNVMSANQMSANCIIICPNMSKVLYFPIKKVNPVFLYY